MKKLNYLKTVAAHSILTAMAADRLGKSLEEYTTEDLDAYFERQQKYFPSNPSNVTTTRNANLAYSVLSSLEFINPVSVQDVPEFMEHLATQPLTFFHFTNAAPMVVAHVIACYSMCADIDVETYEALLDSCLSALDCKKNDYDTAVLFSNMCRMLFETGYFGHHTLKECLNQGLVPARLIKATRTLMRYHLDPNFLGNFDNFRETCDTTNYCEALLLIIMFYMMRVDTAYVNKGYKSSPRAQWRELFEFQNLERSDLAYLYAAFCTVSEFHHPLLKKELRTLTLKIYDVDNLVRTF